MLWKQQANRNQFLQFHPVSMQSPPAVETSKEDNISTPSYFTMRWSHWKCAWALNLYQLLVCHPWAGRDTSLSTRNFNSHNLLPKLDEQLLYFYFLKRTSLIYRLLCPLWSLAGLEQLISIITSRHNFSDREGSIGKIYFYRSYSKTLFIITFTGLLLASTLSPPLVFKYASVVGICLNKVPEDMELYI